jgi:peptide/nickel transport system substrate-binding protein
MKKFLGLSLLVLIVAVLVFSSCTKPEPTTPATSTPEPATSATQAPEPTTPKSGGILTFISCENPAGEIGIPAKWGGLNIIYFAGIFESLLTFDPEGNVVPLLATDYQWSNNNLTLTLNLRKGVKFHDGADFDADAALWNLQKNIDWAVGGSENIESIKKIDDYTIEVNIHKYMNTWTSQFCSGISQMYSPKSYQEKGEEWALQNPVGTGPFKFDKYVQNESVSAVRFADYWGTKTLLDGFKWLFVVDPVTAEMAFESGQADAIIDYSKPNQLVKDMSTKGYSYAQYPGLTWFLIMSSSNLDSPWNKQEVREAAEYAIDKAGICSSVYYGYSIPMRTVLASWDIAYDPNFKGRVYNPAKAKELLTQAGYPDGFKTTFYCATMFNDEAVTTIQDNLKAVGIDTTIDIMSVGKWIDLETHGFDDGIEYCPLYAGAAFDRHVYASWQTPTDEAWQRNGNWWHTFIRPDGMDELVEKAITSVGNSPEDKAADAAIAKLIYDNAMAIGLWEGKGAIVLKDYVKDLQFSTTRKTQIGPWNFTGAWMDK